MRTAMGKQTSERILAAEHDPIEAEVARLAADLGGVSVVHEVESLNHVEPGAELVAGRDPEVTLLVHQAQAHLQDRHDTSEVLRHVDDRDAVGRLVQITAESAGEHGARAPEISTDMVE